MLRISTITLLISTCFQTITIEYSDESVDPRILQRRPWIDTSQSPLNSGGNIIAQFLRSLQCSLDPDNLHLAGGDLSSRFAVTSCSRQAAPVTCQHASKDWHGTFLRLRMRTAEADQSLRTMLSGGQSA